MPDRRSGPTGKAKAPSGGQQHLLRVGELTLDPRSGHLTTPTRTAFLTPIQTRLLRYLMQKPLCPHTDLQILYHVWGKHTPLTARHTVRQHIRHIRLKIEDNPSKPQHLVTRIRFGYLISTPSKPQPSGIIQAPDVLP